MKYAYDLHVHSILSPDADVLMTPNNIFNMAMLKKIDILAITDHNSMAQLPICAEIAQSYDILFVPGVELSLADQFHVLVYFKTLHDAQLFDQILNRYRSMKLIDIKNDMVQGITDIYDNIQSQFPYDLSEDLSLSLYELKKHLCAFHHLLVFAHIDRKKSSGLSCLPDPDVDALELRPDHLSLIEHHQLKTYPIFHNSDAHEITMINERTEHNMIELNGLSIQSFFEVIKHG
jgi:hypothetical protein